MPMAKLSLVELPSLSLHESFVLNSVAESPVVGQRAAFPVGVPNFRLADKPSRK
jgi:hypothetical protein